MAVAEPFVLNEVLVFTPYIGAFGGVERLLLALSRRLYRLGRAHRIICFNDSIGLEKHAAWPLRIQVLKPRRSPWSEASALRSTLRAALEAGAATPLLFDLKSAFYSGMAFPGRYNVHLTDPPSLLPSDISKNARSARRDYPPFAREEAPSLLLQLRAEAVHWVNRRGVRGATKTLVMTRAIADELRQLYGVDAQIVRPGVSVAQVAERGANSNEIKLLSVSRLEANKRIDWILYALGKLEGGTPSLSTQVNWTLHIVGDGSEANHLRELSGTLGIARRVFFHGRIGDDELDRIYNAASLFLMPAVQGYGLPALEALTRNVAVILHQDSGVAEILHDSPWVEIIQQDQEQLAAAIHTMLSRIRNRGLARDTLPNIPTDTSWADHVIRVCDWN